MDKVQAPDSEQDENTAHQPADTDKKKVLQEPKPVTEEADEQSKRLEEYLKKDSTETSDSDKTAWKRDNPTSTLKHYKTLFLRGDIDQLPWEGYSNTGTYKQNEEQSENSIFNRIKSRKDD